MAKFNSNILLAILIVVILIILVYYLNKNNKSAKIKSVDHFNNVAQNSTRDSTRNTVARRPVVNSGEMSDSIIDALLSKHDIAGDITGDVDISNSPMATDADFNSLSQTKQDFLRSFDEPMYEEECDPRDFHYKKNKFTKRTPDDIKDLFDVNKMLPQETEDDWFDDIHMKTAKHINNTHMIHPKKHIGIDTIGSSHKCSIRDIRGDIPNPKISVSPWNNSTIEPDVYARGLCG